MNVDHVWSYTRAGNQRARVAGVLLVVISLAATLVVTSAAGALHARAKSVVISTFKSAKYGTILVDGRTLYTLKPNATTCARTCHKFWSEVLLPKGVSKATAGAGVSATKLGTVKGAGGLLQVTYGGEALYRFYKDRSPGQVSGNGTDAWGKWSVVVLAKSVKSPTTTTSAPKTTTTIAKNPPTTTMPPHPTTTTTAAPGGGGVGF